MDYKELWAPYFGQNEYLNDFELGNMVWKSEHLNGPNRVIKILKFEFANKENKMWIEMKCHYHGAITGDCLIKSELVNFPVEDGVHENEVNKILFDFLDENY